MYTNIKDRFGLEDWTQRFMLANEQLTSLKKKRDSIVNLLKNDEQTSVELVHQYREYTQEVEEFHAQVKDMKQKTCGSF